MAIMKIEVAELSSNSKSISAVALVRGDERIVWPSPGYKSASIVDRECLFDNLNELIEKLPVESQDALWEIYSTVRTIFDSVYDHQEMQKLLKVQVAKLYTVIQYGDVRSFVYRSGSINFPTNLKTEYSENDHRTRNYEARTYLKDEYVDLVILVLAFRFMVPIWGEYVTIVTKTAGNLFKEGTAMDLLRESSIVEWGPMKRLRSYIEFSIDNNHIGLRVLFGGLSTVEIPKHLMALAVVRKLAVSPLNPKTDSDNLIKILYNFVTGTNGRMDSRFGGNVGPKRLIKENGEEDNSSVWDMYKINQDVPDGDKILVEVFTENVVLMAQKVYPDINLSKVDSCLVRSCKLTRLNVAPHQMALCKWVMGKVIAPDSIEALSMTALLNVMAVTQAVLWEMGLPELAIAVTASRVMLDADDTFTAIESNKLDKALVERLHVLYPYWRQDTGKLNPAKRTNLAIQAIQTVSKEANVCEWHSNAPNKLNNEFAQLSVSKTWRLSSDFRSQLATAILGLYENK
jgi:hypothetical protein